MKIPSLPVVLEVLVPYLNVAIERVVVDDHYGNKLIVWVLIHDSEAMYMGFTNPYLSTCSRSFNLTLQRVVRDVG